MTAIEFIDQKNIAVEAHEKKLRSELKSADSVSEVIIAACIESFRTGFDDAARLYESKETNEKCA